MKVTVITPRKQRRGKIEAISGKRVRKPTRRVKSHCPRSCPPPQEDWENTDLTGSPLLRFLFRLRTRNVTNVKNLLETHSLKSLWKKLGHIKKYVTMGKTQWKTVTLYKSRWRHWFDVFVYCKRLIDEIPYKTVV